MVEVEGEVVGVDQQLLGPQVQGVAVGAVVGDLMEWEEVVGILYWEVVAAVVVLLLLALKVEVAELQMELLTGLSKGVEVVALLCHEREVEAVVLNCVEEGVVVVLLWKVEVAVEPVYAVHFSQLQLLPFSL